MESPGILGCEHGGASGTESGWTTYIVSAIHENHHRSNNHDAVDVVDDDDDHCNYKHADIRTGGCPTDDSDSDGDDSMASDASSGPNRHDFECNINERIVGEGRLKHGTGKYSPRQRKIQKQVEQKNKSRPCIKVEEHELVEIEATSAASHVHGNVNSKVKKA